MKRDWILKGTLFESQTTGPQTNTLPLADLLGDYQDRVNVEGLAAKNGILQFFFKEK